MPDALV